MTNKAKSSKKFMIFMIIMLVIVFGGVFGWDAVRAHFIKQFFANFQPPPATISATPVKEVTWQPYLQSVGQLTAVNSVYLSTETAGIIEKIDFKSGQMVQQGEPLIKINDKVEQADLQNAEAELKLAKLNFDRFTKLIKRKAASEADYDKNQAQLTEAQATVAKIQALIAQKNIVAPFSGKIGIRMVSIGQYVSPGDKLVSLQSLNPMYVDFSLPEQYINQLHVGQKVEISTDTSNNKNYTGTITAVNSIINDQTHNVLVRAELPNNSQELYPGLFANVKVLLPQEQNIITIPQTAISYSLFGDSVFVVEQDGKDKKGQPILKVVRKFVKLGEQRNNTVAVKSGLKAGDEVVTSGQLKLENNTHVKINNSVNLAGEY